MQCLHRARVHVPAWFLTSGYIQWAVACLLKCAAVAAAAARMRHIEHCVVACPLMAHLFDGNAVVPVQQQTASTPDTTEDRLLGLRRSAVATWEGAGHLHMPRHRFQEVRQT